MIKEEGGRGKKFKCQVTKVAKIPGFSSYHNQAGARLLPSESYNRLPAFDL